jgi:hypothetical protein
LPLVAGRIASEQLGLHLESADTQLRFFDPSTGCWVPTWQERCATAEENARQAEENARQAEKSALHAEEVNLQLRRELEELRRRLGEESS